MLSNTILMATAAFLGLTAAQSNIVTTYNCDTYKNACAADVAAGKTAQVVCDKGYDACLACITLEHSCRVGAADSYPSQLRCTSSAEACYEMAVSPGQTQGYYGCKEAFASCNAGPLANRSLCASQDGACKSCQKKENECRSAPHANQSYCSSQAGSCFVNAVTSNGSL
ncbi:uncharacterized protein RCC_01839 [Ramularia collo-cygni]|uniref:Uncharacterized protein n=1 Tax=Ramularia collo-cygni TaxID=112498 RepID=A0A2D3V3B8_9PEZI|nr:uncharacterized protein RCC_01839 [Ramularia collo-cygni]CZT15999.1 uncharacterized protein RCC_01839 [Ramularia collo-cygni]